MTIWTLITQLGDGSGSITNGHPDYALYGGTFSFMGTLLGDNVYSVCSLFKPQIDSSGSDWVEGSPTVVAVGYSPSIHQIPQCVALEPCCSYVLPPIIVPAVAPNGDWINDLSSKNPLDPDNDIIAVYDTINQVMVKTTIRELNGGISLIAYIFPSNSIDFANFAFANLSNADFTSVSSAIGVNFNGANLTGASF